MTRISFLRRSILAAAVAGIGLAAGTAQAQTNVLRVVPHSNLAILDPIWTTAYIVRNHGYMVYDTLFALDANGIFQGEIKHLQTGRTTEIKLDRGHGQIVEKKRMELAAMVASGVAAAAAASERGAG